VTLAIALVLFAGFVAVTLVDRRRKHRQPRQAAVPIQRIDLDPPADPTDPTPGPDPDPEPFPWPPTR
jgi:hypothetical protein